MKGREGPFFVYKIVCINSDTNIYLVILDAHNLVHKKGSLLKSSMVVNAENNTGKEFVCSNKVSCPLPASISYKQIQRHYMHACKLKSDTTGNEFRVQSDM